MKRTEKKKHPKELRKELKQAALSARLNAYAPYSKFKVGAALLTDRGKIYSGCNVENSTYGLTICAERNAIFKAISEGAKKFQYLVVVADAHKLTPPCGACRQIIWEFCGDIEIELMNLKKKHARFRMSQLFPKPFDRSFFWSD